MKSNFANDVLQGLSTYPKYLPSKYFYDSKGDKIFQEIMNMPEYYLTDCEYEIFQNNKADILKNITEREGKFHLIEFGAGDGYKTKVLLEYFLSKKVNFEYVPVDISANVLLELSKDLHQYFNNLEVAPVQGDYFHALEQISEHDRDKKVVLFLGSNIGNFNLNNAIAFLKHVASELREGDLFLIGIDLKKQPETILAAYNDTSGITKRFNLNLLDRINTELGANFNVKNFKHYPVYDPQSGECRSYILSLEQQEVTIADLERSFTFDKYESIHTEISRKYSLREIEYLANESGFSIIHNFTDTKGYYVDSLWQLK